ncbi:hypothetical protein DYB28_008602 [Aphanomyces astaci]|uniref:Cilia- and flagella-associated protein 36 n=2 Tax=Aphanomyces astaci TaxID=112090 RepID=A0A397EXU0_APHAT|nr:hypothetical protein DYB36_009006 [Aphanomyces astaci]RHY61427.1 hypothetical protein DYB30_007816 [Aphanomyces astaci]RHY97812.1 hypothetical protein DYB26_005277 [Aphanomyces astaci]RHZ01984.1 hypothetical protein DYB31_013989 [Aphanomyces astaci]RLN99320.1 hypothetical protein DYB28_009739 [Aphanomyces astaci]
MMVREHAASFGDAAESKSDDVEHKHEYKELHAEYLALFEGRIQGFLDKEDVSSKDFYAACEQAIESSSPSAETYKWFVDRLVASMDYKLFYGLMLNEARAQLRRRK